MQMFQSWIFHITLKNLLAFLKVWSNGMLSSCTPRKNQLNVYIQLWFGSNGFSVCLVQDWDQVFLGTLFSISSHSSSLNHQLTWEYTSHVAGVRARMEDVARFIADLDLSLVLTFVYYLFLTVVHKIQSQAKALKQRITNSLTSVCIVY